jgi:hypothetical protein
MKSNIRNIAPLTPSPLTNPRLFSKINCYRRADDIVSFINKEVLQDFESKPFSLIQNKYKQLNSVASINLRKTSEFAMNSYYKDPYTVANEAALFV